MFFLGHDSAHSLSDTLSNTSIDNWNRLYWPKQWLCRHIQLTHTDTRTLMHADTYNITLHHSMTLQNVSFKWRLVEQLWVGRLSCAFCAGSVGLPCPISPSQPPPWARLWGRDRALFLCLQSLMLPASSLNVLYSYCKLYFAFNAPWLCWCVLYSYCNLYFAFNASLTCWHVVCQCCFGILY